MSKPGEPAPSPAPARAGDQTVRLGRSLVQHGPASDRVYLMEADPDDMPALLDQLQQLAQENRYGKIFAKVPARWRQECQAAGFAVEAEVPGFFQGREEGLFLGKYLDQQRRQAVDAEEIASILAACRATLDGTVSSHPAPQLTAPRDRRLLPVEQTSKPAVTRGATKGATGAASYTIRLCTPADCPAMAELFHQVFPSYPFPVDDPAFLAQNMSAQACYAGAWHQQELVALAAAEYSTTAAHAEMTDFATTPQHRRQKLAARLLTALEEEMAKRGIKLAYTIARAISPGINLTFARAGYEFAGTLVNNTQICGQIESMNIWYRQLA